MTRFCKRMGVLAVVAFLLTLAIWGRVVGQAEGDPPTGQVFSLPRESGLVGTEYVESIQKYSTIGADGDLRINLPLFTVPGKIPVPLNLGYKSGIKLDQPATWVGLGWNLGGWSVKRVTVHGDDPAMRRGDRSGALPLDTAWNRWFVPDQFSVTTPSGSYKFYNKGTVDNPFFVPFKQTHVSLECQMSAQLRSVGQHYYYPIERFILTDS